MSVPVPTGSAPAVAAAGGTAAGSYGQILKSTTIVGGAQAINLLIGLARTKLVAVLLGPSGVGLIGLYQSATGLVGTVAGLGIGSSGVRQVAEAAGSGDAACIGRTVRVLRRACWLTGLLGTLLTAALAWPLSQWTFGSPDHTWPIAILGLTLLLGSISSGQMALIQGVRRIGDLARLQVVSAVVGTLLSVGLYAWLGERGIVPVLLLSALINLGASWWFARRVPVPAATVSWPETFREARGLVGLGMAFMLSGLLTAGVALVTRAWILRDFGVEANGFYQAAWGISGVFAGFILQAMGADFYPRLTGVAHDHPQANRLVNEQTEIGILLALPGLLGTLVFSAWLVPLLYSAKFNAAAELLPWFVLGLFGRVLSWPLGYIQLAKGAARWFAGTEALFAALHLLFTWVGLRWLGLWGVALAFALLYLCYTVAMLAVGSWLTGFRWSRSVVKLLAWATAAVGFALLLAWLASPGIQAGAGGLLVAITGYVCLRQLQHRLGPAHRISRMLNRLPGFPA